MIEKIMKKYAMSRQGAKDFITAVCACTVSDIILMFPVGLLYYMTGDLLHDTLSKERIVFYSVGIAISILLIFISQYCQYNATFFLTYKESGKRRITIAETLRKLPLSFFGKKDLSDLTATVLNDCAVIEQTFSHHAPQFYGSVISTVIIAVSLFFFNVRMALAAVWVLPVSLLAVLLSKRAQMKYTERKTAVKVKMDDHLQETVEAFRDLKSNNAELKAISEIDGFIKDYEKKSVVAELGVAAYIVPAQMFLKIGIATTALVGSKMLLSGGLDVLSFFMFMLVVSRIYEPMNATLVNLGAMNATQINIDRTNAMNDTPKQEGKTDFSPKNYDIEFKNIGFSYNEDEAVLENVSFIAKQGEVTALVGPSGGGKTTVSRLAARFWDATSGSIELGGQDISKIDPETLLQSYSIVFQDVTLFNNTIMENIRIGKKDATDEEVLAAAKLANCDEFASKLPDGYNSIIGENGSELSGGERQRVSIARAFLKDAPIILLDEATSSLDVENETAVQTAISKLIKDKTVLVIAHRMRTVAAADKIIVLSDGKVAEQGSPDELMNKNGMYARMARLQNESGKWSIA